MSRLLVGVVCIAAVVVAPGWRERVLPQHSRAPAPPTSTLSPSPPPPRKRGRRSLPPTTTAQSTLSTGVLDGCKHVYLDVGANIGLQVRKLFEPERFPGALIQPVFDRYFGADVARRRAEVCAVGFEPNLDLTSRLAELGERYTRLGWRTSFLKAAASTRDGNVTFYRDVSFVGARNNQWGASMFASSFNQALGARARRAAMTVPTIDLAEWMLAEVVNRRLPPEASSSESVQRPRVVMKLEGAY